MMEYYSAAILFAILTVIVLIVQAAQNDALSKQVKLGIITASLLIIVAASCEYAGVALDGGANDLRVPHLLVKFMELSLVPAIPIIFGNAIYPLKSIRYWMAPLVLHTLVEFLSMWFGITFYVNADNVYLHCSHYWLYYVAYLFGFMVMIVQIIRFNRCYQSQNRLSLFLIMLFVSFGIVWQAVNSSMKVVWLAMSIGDVLFYVFYCDLLQQIDPLTKLLNRRSYDNRAKLIRRRAVVLFADVDAFKSVNDHFGHPFGDHCLEMVGAALKAAYGKYGLCYRIGGDEFCVILTRQLDAIEEYNSDFFALLDGERRSEPRLPHVSVGYAVFEPEKMTVLEAAAKADEMMYTFKKKAKAADG